ncbi:gamma-glutamyl-gamma-aminobutyrate hydrolase family protein [Cryobacterium tepidiphilum]|uniref:Gamma-glutamyl-gamma-aminobutyrate hydrolase family protein n=1 Tax=Cryobacterium tepidiphilum TaxID=2486026 RepID=A0A3M8LDJ3_9MICO|nr:gamma-glutamyl-gamma-aminobutyrate hydrolase family protein [Cryobacterium tepidiphilum]RNE63613.1 gamma-glutamyl-gamma-aminobutyrate hydrolase family protein [Cryobacterium tepidiphilum]
MNALAGAPRLAVVEVTAHRPDQPAYHAKVQTLVGRVLSDARQGGWQVSRHAAADVTLAALLEATADADGIVIVGGEDLAPHFYGGQGGYEGETRHYPAADEGQIAVVRRALAEQTPLLGICRGLQVINVALGGTVDQHIGDGGIHRNAFVPIEQVLATHAVTLHDDSRLAGIHGGSTILVESAHHQAVARVGVGLVPAAVAPDGIIEALEHVSAPIIGVQWHPEAPGAAAHHLPLLLQALGEQVAAESVAA